jgi:PPM family protein phosphatase
MGARLVFLNETKEQPEAFDFTLGQVVAVSRGWDASSRENEDCLLVRAVGDSVVLAVADGAGGGPTGGKASRLAIEALDAQLNNGESIRSAILDGFEAANQALLALGTGLATTLSVVELRQTDGVTTLRSYHVGDSSVLVTGARGKLKLTTVSHSPVGYGVEAGLISADEALHHEDLNIVSNLIGMANMRIEMGSEIALAPRDTVVLGSDGLFDNLHSQEVVALTRRGKLFSVAEELSRRVLERMNGHEPGQPSKPDDLGFIVFRQKKGAAAKPTTKSNTKSRANAA